MSRKLTITLSALLLTCAMTGAVRADSLSDPTRPPTAGRVQEPGELQLEGVLCHAGAFVAIANDRLIHAGDRVNGVVIRSISAPGVLLHPRQAQNLRVRSRANPRGLRGHGCRRPAGR